MDATNVEKSFNQPQKVKFLCMLCKGDHLHRNFPDIPKGLEVWSIVSIDPFHQPLAIMLVIKLQLVIIRSIEKKEK